MELTAENVWNILHDCFFEEEPAEDDPDVVAVDAIAVLLGLSKIKVEAHKAEIGSLLLELPEEFRMSNPAKGWSFLNACNDRHGHQWGEHKDMASLFALGEAAGLVKCLMPRELWAMMPGGMPYYVILDVQIAKEDSNA